MNSLRDLTDYTGGVVSNPRYVGWLDSPRGWRAVCSGESVAEVRKLVVQFYGEQTRVTILPFGRDPETSFLRGGLGT